MIVLVESVIVVVGREAFGAVVVLVESVVVVLTRVWNNCNSSGNSNGDVIDAVVSVLVVCDVDGSEMVLVVCC